MITNKSSTFTKPPRRRGRPRGSKTRNYMPTGAVAGLRTTPLSHKRTVGQRIEPHVSTLQEASVDEPVAVEEEAHEGPGLSSDVITKEFQEEIDESATRLVYCLLVKHSIFLYLKYLNFTETLRVAYKFHQYCLPMGHSKIGFQGNEGEYQKLCKWNDNGEKACNEKEVDSFSFSCNLYVKLVCLVLAKQITIYY